MYRLCKIKDYALHSLFLSFVDGGMALGTNIPMHTKERLAMGALPLCGLEPTEAGSTEGLYAMQILQ